MINSSNFSELPLRGKSFLNSLLTLLFGKKLGIKNEFKNPVLHLSL